MRANLIERRLEHFQRIAALGLTLNLVQSTINDLFGGRLFAVIHQDVHKFGNQNFAELRIRENFTFFCATTTSHYLSPYFGRLAPYIERRFLRSLTPCVSSVPRMMW